MQRQPSIPLLKNHIFQFGLLSLLLFASGCSISFKDRLNKLPDGGIPNAGLVLKTTIAIPSLSNVRPLLNQNKKVQMVGGASYAAYQGYSDTAGSTIPFLLKLNSNGGINATYGSQGALFMSIPPGLPISTAAAFVMASDQTTYWVLETGDNGQQPVLVKYTANGKFDSDFGAVALSCYYNGRTQLRLTDSDSKIVVGCDYVIQSNPQTGQLMRFSSSGEPDFSFGSPNGYLYLPNPLDDFDVDAQGGIHYAATSYSMVQSSLVPTARTGRIVQDGSYDTGYQLKTFSSWAASRLLLAGQNTWLSKIKTDKNLNTVLGQAASLVLLGTNGDAIGPDVSLVDNVGGQNLMTKDAIICQRPSGKFYAVAVSAPALTPNSNPSFISVRSLSSNGSLEEDVRIIGRI